MRNLTEVSLKNRSLIWYFIFVTAIGGIFSYFNLGRMEDPAFTIRQMVVTVAWPGATAEQMSLQVTDKLEKKIQDTPHLKYVKSETRSGSAIIHVVLNDDLDKSQIRPTWRDVRNFCEDVKSDLPEGVYGPYYNDRFDDVYGSIYALIGDGFNYEELRQRAEKIRQIILGLDNVQKVELLGVQPEKIYVEIERAKLSELGISPTVISNTLSQANQMTPAGMIETSSDNVYLRVTGIFDDVESIKNLPINSNGRIFKLSDIAKIERRFIDPAEEKFYFNGEAAIGIAISMEDGGNILKLGEDLNSTIEKIQSELPIGLEIHQVANQSEVVDRSIHDFVKTLIEAIVIVLIVSFASLGLRTGLVVAFCIPLVLAGTFCFMYILGIDLHKVSLGALIISLGLLVDDSIIAVEMMSVQLERGFDKFKAACYAFDMTAKPMLTGTLITCSGFIPVAFADGLASEFCSALFPVILIALLLSWIVSVMIAPLFGGYLIKINSTEKKDPYQNKFYALFRRILELCLSHRKIVISLTLIAFAISIFIMKFIKQEFFPSSLRPEIIVEMTLPNGSSMTASQIEADHFSEFLKNHAEDIENFSYYVGQGAPRFVLTMDVVLPKDNYAQFIIVAKDTESREKLTAEIREELNKNFPNVRSNIKYIQTGPPAEYPVMIRVSGYNVDLVKALASEAANRLANDPNLENVHLDWFEKSKTLHIEVDQDKLRSLGVSSQAVKQMLYTEITGAKSAEFYTNDRTIDIDFRILDSERNNLSQIKNLPIYLGNNYVPLEQIAKISFDAEDGLIKRRDLNPTITIQANIKSGTANDATKKAYQSLSDLKNSLPIGYSIEAGGSFEDSETSMKFLIVPIPAMIFIIMTLLMFQLRNAKDMILTVLTAPLGLIGVSLIMLLMNKSMGFVAVLGILALFGMIIRNSVILIDQIQKHLATGETLHDSIVDSAILRFRPIMLTAAAAILGMIPLMVSEFWGPMAVAIAGGLLVATVLTLLVLPVMYDLIERRN